MISFWVLCYYSQFASYSTMKGRFTVVPMISNNSGSYDKGFSTRFEVRNICWLYPCVKITDYEYTQTPQNIFLSCYY
jgi:hypothetical protein